MANLHIFLVMRCGFLAFMQLARPSYIIVIIIMIIIQFKLKYTYILALLTQVNAQKLVETVVVSSALPMVFPFFLVK